MTSLRAGKALFVSVLAKNTRTLTELLDYFEQVGVAASGSADLGAGAGLPAATTAVVLFPDEFDDPAIEALREIRRKRPRLLLVLVTREPQRFRSMTLPDDRSRLPLVLPKPSFGSAILDAIRSHAAASSVRR